MPQDPLFVANPTGLARKGHNRGLEVPTSSLYVVALCRTAIGLPTAPDSASRQRRSATRPHICSPRGTSKKVPQRGMEDSTSSLVDFVNTMQTEQPDVQNVGICMECINCLFSLFSLQLLEKRPFWCQLLVYRLCGLVWRAMI